MFDAVVEASADSPPDAGSRCDVVVPDQLARVGDAVAAAPVPGVVCVRPGSYPGAVELRDGVDVEGLGDGVRICGGIHGQALGPRGVTLRRFELPYPLLVDGFERLTLEDLRVGMPFASDGCSGFDARIHVTSDLGRSMRFAASGLRVGSPGVELVRTIPDQPVQDDVLITRSRCVDPRQCYELASLTFNQGGQISPDSSFTVEVSNNLIPRTALEGIVVSGATMPPTSVVLASRMLIVNNTLSSPGDSNYGIVFWGDFPGRVVVANNAVAYLAHPIWRLPTHVTLGPNALSNDPSSMNWFQDFATNDLRPAPASPLLGAADPQYVPAVDVDGQPRARPYNMGAY